MFCNAAVTEVQLLHILEGLGWFVVWLECFLEGLHKFFICPPVQFIGFCFFAFFNLCLDKLLFPDSGISSC
jgi:hypothetical protein